MALIKKANKKKPVSVLDTFKKKKKPAYTYETYNTVTKKKKPTSVLSSIKKNKKKVSLIKPIFTFNK